MLKENGEQLLKKFADTAYPPTVEEITSGIYHVMGYGHSNSIIIEADSSVIVIDTLDTDVRAEKLKKIIADITEKPVKTIIYTHGHPDHRGGASAFCDTASEIIAFALKKPVLGRTNELNDILNKRTSYQFGYKLSDEEVIIKVLAFERDLLLEKENMHLFQLPLFIRKKK
jgi:alkyl sulfatase BDS1-like metallo-beta-lactamase superfamily hydrolase